MSTKNEIDKTRRDLAAMVAGVKQAAARFEADKAKLFTQAGKPVYNTDMHLAKMKALQDGAIADAKRTADEIAAAQTKITELEAVARAEATSLAAFSTADLERAAALRPFIEDDVAKLDNTNLAANLRAAVNGQDKVAAMLYSRLLADRREEAAQGKRDRWSNEIELLQRELAGPTAAQLEEVEALRQAAIDARIETRLFQAGVDGSLEANNKAFTQSIRAW